MVYKGETPKSRLDLSKDFNKIGIKAGMNLMVHSSLSKIGYVIGGAPTVVSALMDVIGNDGTIVMPAKTPLCKHPESWEDKKIPENWVSKISKHLPVFDADITPTSMGAIPEAFRSWPDTLRSYHPTNSVCAWGKLAAEVTQDHNFEVSEGANTPYEKVYDLNFQLLLLGVGFDRCTMLHFSESKSMNPRFKTSNYPIIRSNEKVWVSVKDMGDDNGTHFPKIGELYVNHNDHRIGTIGEADSILFPVRNIVDFGIKYFNDTSNH